MDEGPHVESRERPGEVVVAVDRSGPVALVVIADISGDDAWLSIPESEAPDLATWR